MSFHKLGAVFGALAKKIETKLDFLPEEQRRWAMVAVMVCGMPLFLVAFLFFRAWLIKPEPHQMAEIALDMFREPKEKGIFEEEEDGYRLGWQGYGYYIGGIRIRVDNDDDIHNN